jgi:hypothetical protein
LAHRVFVACRHGLGILNNMPRDFAEVQRELEKIFSVLRRTKESDRIPRQMLLAELRLLLEELERLNSGAKD